MLFKVQNKILIENVRKTFLTAASDAADTTLTVVDITGFGIGDYVILGEPGEEGTEVIRLHASTPPSGTTITLVAGGTAYVHGIDTPVYRADYNKAEFSRATTLTGTKTVLSTSDIDPSEDFTYYEDTTNVTGYGFVRFSNSSDSTATGYSGGVNYADDGDYSTFDPRTLHRMRKGIRVLINEDRVDSIVTDDQIRDAVNDEQRDIGHRRLWSFFEMERSLSAVDNQFAYDIPSTVQKIHLGTFDTQPLAVINYTKWKNLHWDTDQISDPSLVCVWNNQMLLYPRPDSDASATTIDDESDISASDTTIVVDSSQDFTRGDYYRFIIDSEVIYATEKSYIGTTLTADVAVIDTIITVASASAFADSGTITIDEDVITYTGTTATTFTGCSGIGATHDSGDTVSYSDFTGCLRGREDTTAATHSDGTTITERDIVYAGNAEPVNLFKASDRTLVPEPEVLELGAASKLAFLLEKETLADRLDVRYSKAIKSLESKYAIKVTQKMGRIKNREEIVSDTSAHLNPNLYPKSI